MLYHVITRCSAQGVGWTVADCISGRPHSPCTGRVGVKLREGSQTPMVVGESGGNLPRAAGDETLSKEQRRFLVGLPNTDRRQKRTQKGELQKSKLS